MITKKREEKIKRVVENRQAGVTVVLEDIHDPHNAAAILRSCDSFGVQNVYFIFKTVKPYNPAKVGKVSSSSANKWLSFKIFDSTEKCFAELKKDGYEIFSTILDDQAKSIYKTKFTGDKIALVIGNEHAGISKECIELTDHKVYIPMQGMVQSLNVSVTAGISLFAISEQRFGEKKYLLDSDGQKGLMDELVKR